MDLIFPSKRDVCRGFSIAIIEIEYQWVLIAKSFRRLVLGAACWKQGKRHKHGCSDRRWTLNFVFFLYFPTQLALKTDAQGSRRRLCPHLIKGRLWWPHLGSVWKVRKGIETPKKLGEVMDTSWRYAKKRWNDYEILCRMMWGIYTPPTMADSVPKSWLARDLGEYLCLESS